MVHSDPRARRRGFLPPHGESVDNDTEEHDSAEGVQINVRINIRPKLKARIVVAPSRFAPPRGRNTTAARLKQFSESSCTEEAVMVPLR